MKYRTRITAEAEVVEPNTQDFKAIASSLKSTYGFDLKPQMDLMYVRSCLVSAGESAGVNKNDDIFTREEAWAARHTPVLKPFNWQHQDTDIVGVMYSVQARDLNGDVLDINSDEVPDCDFDLYVEAAIFSLIHQQKSQEIQARAEANKLFVSMEAWFDDYGYGFFNEDNCLQKAVSRNDNTSFLDKHLRAAGGTGTYHDPDDSQDVRVGRILRGITFGGCGFVDQPANNRSVIEAAEPMNSFAEQDLESQVLSLLDKVMDSKAEELSKEINNMPNQPEKTALDAEAVASVVEGTLDKREKAAAEAREKEALQTRASELETENETLQTSVDELSAAKEAKDVEVQALQQEIEQYSGAVDTIITEHTEAGATSSTPAEIAAIDGASDGDAAFAAKLAWIGQSMASLRDRAARADELEAQLAEAQSVVREQEVRAMLSGFVSDEAVDAMVARASDLDDEAFAAWRDEKELMIIEMNRSEAKEDCDKAEKKGKKENPFKKEEKKDAKADENPFTALLATRRAESDATHMINHPGGEGVNCGVNSGALKTPRHKIAGSAGDNPADLLDNAQEEGGVSLAGSQIVVEDSDNPFEALAGIVVRNVKDNDVQAEKPGFDPVS